jgi:alpha-amylase
MKNILFLSLLLACIVSCKNNSAPEQKKEEVKKELAKVPVIDLKTPDWVKNANIYEVNIRQYSKEGNIKAFMPHIARLKKMGVDVLWLMPIYPICEKEKKCDPKVSTPCFGSAYAAYDFKAVHPSLGTMADVKGLVAEAHKLGMKVILDFVPDHTGWDSKWMKEHPEYFLKINGKFTIPLDPADQTTGKLTDWTDVAMLDYKVPALRAAITDAHLFWIKEADVDGFREDVAGAIPNDYWSELRTAINAVKPVLMLSEWEDDPRHLDSGFEMNYGWMAHKMLKRVAKGLVGADTIDTYLKADLARNNPRGWHIMFTQNHDENTWNGTLKESFGDGGDCFTALCLTMDGMGLVYSGQEVSLDKRLAFFNKDEIDWKGASKEEFFRKLLDLKHRNKAIWNGLAGGRLVKIPSSDDKKIYAFVREKDGDKVVGIFNLSKETVTTSLSGGAYAGKWSNVMENKSVEMKADSKMVLKPWEFVVLSNK